jgi:diacylglycerol O-acyltransferase
VRPTKLIVATAAVGAGIALVRRHLTAGTSAIDASGDPFGEAGAGGRAAWRRMGGMDSGFLSLELPDQPMTNLYLILLTPETPGDRLSVEDVKVRFEERLDYLPALRWRLLEIPHGLDHPIWVDDPDFDLDRHILVVRLDDADGGQLSHLCGRLAAGQLARDRPLWDVTLVDGLAGGGQALVWRTHHCLIDGAATVTTLSRFFADSQDLETIERSPFRPGALPDERELIAEALRAQARRVRGLPGLVRRTGAAVKARQEFERAAPVKPPEAPADIPPSSLNDAFGPVRHITTAELDMDSFRLVRRAAGVTFTDVCLAVVAGALRETLLAAEQLPDRPLVAGCPVSLEDSTASGRQWGNKFSSFNATLATDIDDAWERLAAISEVSAVARRSNEYLGDELWQGWLDAMPPMLTAPAVKRHHAERRQSPDEVNASVTISSVPGPATPWRFGSFACDRIWLAGPPNNGVGAMIALFTYGGRVLVAVNSIEDSIADPPRLVEAMEGALAELVEAATGATAVPSA